MKKIIILPIIKIVHRRVSACISSPNSYCQANTRKRVKRSYQTLREEFKYLTVLSYSMQVVDDEKKICGETVQPISPVEKYYSRGSSHPKDINSYF